MPGLSSRITMWQCEGVLLVEAIESSQMLYLYKSCKDLSSREPRQQPLDHDGSFLDSRDDVWRQHLLLQIIDIDPSKRGERALKAMAVSARHMLYAERQSFDDSTTFLAPGCLSLDSHCHW